MYVVVPLAAVAVTLPAAAAVYSTPTVAGITAAQVATAGEDTPYAGMTMVAVNPNGGTARSSGVSASNGGDAVGWSGVAVSNGGNAGGALGVSHGGQAEGNADYFGLFGGAAVATTGDARYGTVNASVFGDAYGVGGISGTGDGAIGNRTVVDAYDTEADTVRSTGLVVEPGHAVAETPAQLEQIAMNPPDPQAMAQKLQDLAMIAPDVATLQVLPDGEQRSSTATSSDKPPRKKWLPGFNAAAQPNGWTCVMTSVAMVLNQRGYSHPGIYQLHSEAKGTKKGLTMKAARPQFNRYYRGGGGSDEILYTEIKDKETLLNAVVLDVWKYQHGLVIPIRPEYMNVPGYWDGLHTMSGEGGHAVAAWGYNFEPEGIVNDTISIVDPFDSSQPYAGSDWDADNPLGPWTFKVDRLWMGLTGQNEHYVDW